MTRGSYQSAAFKPRQRGGHAGDPGRWRAGKSSSALSSVLQYYCRVETPKHRPLERFWPYADLPEQLTDEEMAALDPDLRDVLFGAQSQSFSVTLVFPQLDVPEFSRALDLARGSVEFHETGHGEGRRYRARFPPTDADRLHKLFEIVGTSAATEVLIDGRPVPYARQLWLPLVWFFIGR